MEDLKKKPFNKRAFVVLTIAVAGLGLPFSGLANHLLQMDPMNLPRHAAMAAHTALGVLFLVFAAWHLILNRRTLGNYLNHAFSRLSGIGREAFWALTFVAAVLFAAVGHAFLAP